MILKPIDENYNCLNGVFDVDDVLRNIFNFNNIKFIETDIAGAQIDIDPYEFIAINRVLLIRPISKNPINKYSSASYDCLLTIAKASEPSLEVENTSTDGQFDTITKEFLSLEFMNTLRSYFTCCNHKVNIVQIKPIWNSTIATKRVNHSGVEINLTIEL